MKKLYTTGRPELDRLISELIEQAGGSAEQDLLQQMMVTIIHLLEERVERGELKIINSTLKELRYAIKVFTPYRGIRKVTIFGSARTPKASPQYRQAKEFSREMVRRGWMVITGGATGIMSAGNEGAGRAKSCGMNVRLPFEQEANPVMAEDPKLINFKYFFTRKLTFLKESDATVLFPGGYGTHDEGFETLTLVQTGKTEPRPIVCIDTPGSNYWKLWREFVEKELLESGMIDAEDLDLVDFTQDAKRAVEIVTGFYRNFHSLRFVGDDLVIRMHRPLSIKQSERLNRDFRNIIRRGRIHPVERPLPEEENEPSTHRLARLVFDFNRKDFSLLRKLINTVNQKE